MERCLAVIVLLQVVLGQVPTPCESPRQWQGRAIQVDRSERFERRMRISYDEVGRRVQYTELAEIGRQRNYFDILELYHERKSYVLNLKTRQCNITDITTAFHPIGLPTDASFVEMQTLGLAGVPLESLTVYTFALDRGGDHFFGTVTYPDCVPVMDGFFSNRTGLVQTSFSDITLGIADPAVFVPPPECLQASEKRRLRWKNIHY